MNTENSSSAIKSATESRASFSGRGNAKGAAGYVNPNDVSGKYDFISREGETMSISPTADGFKKIRIGAAWDVQQKTQNKLFGLVKRTVKQDIDLDLGCLYELQDGTRGALQAFGQMYGDLKKPPVMQLSGDERTGHAEGEDEYILINGAEWSKIRRVITYVYIYDGALDWAQVRPQIQVRVPGEKPLVCTLSAHMKDLSLCVIAGLENKRNGMVVTNYTEYFPGHAEMDRAYGFGLDWTDGVKQPL